MLVARIGALDDIGAGFDAQDEIDDVFQRHIGGVRAGPASPANVIADLLLGDAFERVVERVHLHRHPIAILVESLGRHLAVVGDGGARVVDCTNRPLSTIILYSVRIASAMAWTMSSSLR